MIRLRNLNKQYASGGKVITPAKDITVDIPENQFVVIFGESGSGKSTLLNMVGGLLRPDSGEVEVNQTKLGTLSANGLADYRNVKCGFVFQSYNLIPYLTAADNIVFSLMLKNWKKRSAERRADEVLAQLGMSSKRLSKPNTMSGGEQQRVALGRAIAHKPSLILADEPTGNLDERNADEVLRLLADLHTQYHATILVASHSEKVKRYATLTLALRDGSLQQRQDL